MALIAWYKLDGNALDSSGNRRDGSTVGTPNVVAGKIGSSYSFDYGSSDGISIPNNKFPLYDFTMTAWIKPVGNHYHYDGTIISSGNWNGSHWSFGVNQSNTGFSCRHPSASGAYAFTLNTWHFVVYRREGTNLKLYANNTLVYDGTVTSYIPLSSDATDTCIGRETYAGGYFGFNGSIDDVRIYDHTLSEKEIKELAKAKVLHYTFDEFQEPTENLYTSQINSSSDWLNSGTAPTINNNNTSAGKPIGIPDAVLVRSCTMSAPASYHFGRAAVSIIAGNTYTLSTWYYQTAINTGSVPYARSVDTSLGTMKWEGNDSTSASTWPVNQWIRLYITFTASTGQTSVFVSSYPNFATYPNTMYMTAPQLELKDHATPFVNGIRTGSISDNSGYDNHADLALATTPQWVEDSRIGKGAYEFNGTASNYIVFPHTSIGLPSLTNCTISFWRKKTTAGGWLLLRGQTNSHYVMATSSGTGAFYHSSAGTSWQIFVDGVIRANPIDDTNWHHYVMRNVDLSTWTELTLNNYSSWYFRGILDDFRIYNTVLTDDDIKELYQTRAQIDNKGNFFANNIEEPANIASIVNEAIVNKTFTNGVSSYTQANCQVSLTDNGYRIYRPANLIYPDAGNTMWGGLKINLFNNEESKIEKGKRYRISFLVNGKTSNSPGNVYFSNNMGWGGGGLTNVGFSYNDTIPTNFNGVKRVVAETNVIDDVYKVCTTSYSSFVAGQYYNCYKDLCFGFGYQSTGTLGTDIYITDFKIQEITDNNKNSISENGIAKMFEISELGPTNGLVAYYPLNGDAKDYANANDGTVNGAIISAGINGKACYSFDGVDDYIDCGDKEPVKNINAAITVSLWAKYDTYVGSGGSQSYSVVVVKGSPWTFLMENPSNKIRFRMTVGGSDLNASDTVSHELNRWYFFTGVYDGTAIKMYKDAVLVGTTSATGAISTNSSTMKIGTYTGNTYNMDGTVQNVRIYNRALSAEEIKILYDIESLTAQVKLTSNEMYVAGEFKEAL